MTALASRRNQFLYIVLIVIGAGFVLVYRGIGWSLVRGYAGDWLIVQLMYVLARLVIPYRWRYPLALAVLIFAFAVEAVQFLAAGSIPQNVATELTIGSTFDWGDLIAYTLGVATVLLTERLWKPERSIRINIALSRGVPNLVTAATRADSSRSLNWRGEALTAGMSFTGRAASVNARPCSYAQAQSRLSVTSWRLIEMQETAPAARALPDSG